MTDVALPSSIPASRKRLTLFERYLTLWVALCMVFGVLAGQWWLGTVAAIRAWEFGDGSHINLPMAVLIWLMIFP
jgi:arsenite transporter